MFTACSFPLPFSKARGNWGGPQVLSPVSQSTLIIHSTLFPFNFDLKFNANCIFLCLKLFIIYYNTQKQRKTIESEGKH